MSYLDPENILAAAEIRIPPPTVQAVIIAKSSLKERFAWARTTGGAIGTAGGADFRVGAGDRNFWIAL